MKVFVTEIAKAVKRYKNENVYGREVITDWFDNDELFVFTCVATEDLAFHSPEVTKKLLSLYHEYADIVPILSEPICNRPHNIGGASAELEYGRAITFMLLSTAQCMHLNLEYGETTRNEEERYIAYLEKLLEIIDSTKSEYLDFYVDHIIMVGAKGICEECLEKIQAILANFMKSETAYHQIERLEKEASIIKPYKEARKVFGEIENIGEIVIASFEWFKSKKERERIKQGQIDPITGLPLINNPQIKDMPIPLDRIPSVFHVLAASNNEEYRKDFTDAMANTCNTIISFLSCGLDPNLWFTLKLTDEIRNKILRRCALSHLSDSSKITFSELAAATISYAMTDALSAIPPFGFVTLLQKDMECAWIKANKERDESDDEDDELDEGWPPEIDDDDYEEIISEYNEEALHRWYKSELEENMQPLKEELAELKKTAAELQAKNEELKASGDRKLKNAEKSYYMELSRLRDMIKSFEAENQKLKKEKAELQELNESFFVPEETDEVVETTLQFSTFNKNIIYIGGNVNVRNKMQEKYPDMTILDGTVPPAEAALAGADLIILNTGCMSHLAFYKIMSIIKKRDIKIAYCKNYTNLQLLDQELARITKKHFGER